MNALCVLALDITGAQSIGEIVEAAGAINVLINNAGIGLLSVFEDASVETIQPLSNQTRLGR